MKLSEALLFGEYSTKPHHGWWFKIDDKGKVCGACAVGRLCLSSGYQPKIVNGILEEHIEDLAKFVMLQWPWTIGYRVEFLPLDYDNDTWVGDEYDCNCDVVAAISDLYEEHDWSMKDIAAWIATIEPKEVAVGIPTTEHLTHCSSIR